jgi:hypothetical protein
MSDTATLPQFDRKRHGSLFDRGGADSYYLRAFDPHWYPGGTYKGEKVIDLTPEEVAEYAAGYNARTASGEFKQY